MYANIVFAMCLLSTRTILTVFHCIYCESLIESHRGHLYFLNIIYVHQDVLLVYLYRYFSQYYLVLFYSLYVSIMHCSAQVFKRAGCHLKRGTFSAVKKGTISTVN